LVSKLANVGAISAAEKVTEGSITFLVGTTEYAIDLGSNVDPPPKRRRPKRN
jgi:hypothetical protein